MFNEKLFFDLCEKYGVELKDGRRKPMIYDSNGIPREIDRKDVYNIVEPYQTYFDYEHENFVGNVFDLASECNYSDDYEYALAC